MSSDECRKAIQTPVFDHYNKPQPVKAEAVASGIPSGNTLSAPAQNGPVPLPTATEVPAPTGRAVNPIADAKSPMILPPGSPFQPTQTTGNAGTMPALSLLNPYRKTG